MARVTSALNKARETETLSSNAVVLGLRIHWADMAAKSAEADTLERRLDADVPVERLKLEQKIEATEAELEAVKLAQAAFQADLARCTAIIQEQQAAKSTADASFRSASRARNDAEAEAVAHSTDLETLRSDLARARTDVESQRYVWQTQTQAQADAEQASQSQAAAANPHTARVAQLEQEVASFRAQIVLANSSIDAQKLSVEQLADAARQLTDEHNVKQQSKTQLEKQRQDLLAMQRSGNTDRSSLFECSQALREAIDRERNFSHKPIGRIGALLSLRDIKYARVTEVALSSLLDSFIVDNIKDRGLLVQVARRANCRLGKVIISSFRIPGPALPSIPPIAPPCVPILMRLGRSLRGPLRHAAPLFAGGNPDPENKCSRASCSPRAHRSPQAPSSHPMPL